MTTDELKTKTGDFLLDIAKLIVAGVVLSSIFDASMSKSTAIWWGISAIIALVFAAYVIFYNSLKK